MADGWKVVRGRAAGRDWWARVGRSAGGQPDPLLTVGQYNPATLAQYNPTLLSSPFHYSLHCSEYQDAARDRGRGHHKLKNGFKDTVKVQGNTHT